MESEDKVKPVLIFIGKLIAAAILLYCIWDIMRIEVLYFGAGEPVDSPAASAAVSSPAK